MTKIDPGWLDAAIKLDKDPNAVALCPKCSSANLRIRNVWDSKNPKLLIERIMTCPACSASNAILVNREMER